MKALTKAERENLRRVIQAAWIFVVSACRMIKNSRDHDALKIAEQSEQIAEVIDQVLTPAEGKS